MKLYFPLYCLHPFVTGWCNGTIKHKVVIAAQRCSYEVSGFYWRLFLSLSNNRCVDEINEKLNSMLLDNSCSYIQRKFRCKVLSSNIEQILIITRCQKVKVDNNLICYVCV